MFNLKDHRRILTGKGFTFFFIFFILSVNAFPQTADGQDQTVKPFQQYTRINEALKTEKIYLHLDRQNFVSGDTIWFKAYLWFGYEQLPDTFSKILYVDLLNAKGQVEQKRKLLIENGTSVGEFCLGKAISSGKYTLCAYTNYMRNQGTGDPFLQTITVNAIDQSFQVDCAPVILKSREGDSLKVTFRFYQLDDSGDLKKELGHKVDYSLRIGNRVLRTDKVLAENTKEQMFKWPLPALNGKDSFAILGISVKEGGVDFEKQFRIPLKEDLDLQFFPEGGKMVEGLESKVAFKAIGTDGLSREVNGMIRDDKGEFITLFKSSHKGMGYFFLKPETGKKYTAYLEFNQRKYQFALPGALKNGSVMAIRSEDDRKSYLTIRYNTKDTFKYVVGSAYGKTWFAARTKVTRDYSRLLIPKDRLPEGVAKITVLGEDFKPQCERLIYVDRDQCFRIEVKPDSSSYGKRSKVTLSIRTSAKDGEPVQSDLSLAVVDKEQVNSNGIKGICTYKLLHSELKGEIEAPDFYFKGDSCLDHKALDLLMLTQGYREFITDTLVKPKYLPETGFDVQGEIKADGSKSRAEKYNYRNVGLTLLAGSDTPYFNFTNPDSLGRFAFQIPLQYGRVKSILKATRDGKRPFYGEVAVDEPFMPKFARPLQINTNTSLPVIETVQRLLTVRKSQLKTIDLPEVTVKGRAKNWYYDLETRTKKIMNLDSIDPHGNKYKNIYDLLIREYEAKWNSLTHTIVLPCIRNERGGNTFFPIYIIDGHIYWNGEDKDLTPLEHLAAYDVNQIKRIMVIPPERLPVEYAATWIYIGEGGAGPHISQSTVVIETYGSAFYRGQKPGMKTFILDGLDKQRTFYSPRYEGPNRQNPVYDGRATLFWEPLLKTDKNGEAKVEFYTGDRETEMEVIVKGIDVRNGNVGEGQKLIKNKTEKTN